MDVYPEITPELIVPHTLRSAIQTCFGLIAISFFVLLVGRFWRLGGLILLWSDIALFGLQALKIAIGLLMGVFTTVIGWFGVRVSPPEESRALAIASVIRVVELAIVGAVLYWLWTWFYR